MLIPNAAARPPLEQASASRWPKKWQMRLAMGYDWNMLPIGQQLWEKELLSYQTFPPLQAAETYNLTGILDMMKKGSHPSD
jgi:hypothetical protein